jgi:hypothetical protein
MDAVKEARFASEKNLAWKYWQQSICPKRPQRAASQACKSRRVSQRRGLRMISTAAAWPLLGPEECSLTAELQLPTQLCRS